MPDHASWMRTTTDDNFGTTEHQTFGTTEQVQGGTTTIQRDEDGSHKKNDGGGKITICNLNDYQRVARTKVSKALYQYLASGTDDEITLRMNRSSFSSIYLRPRVMRPVGKSSTKTTSLFGQPLSMPVFVTPAGVQALCDPDHGECATARACGRTGIMFGLSQHATRSIEDVAGEAPKTNRWFQSYILKDRALTLRLVKRAIRAGYRGIFLTVDSVRFGYREADVRNGFDALPPPHRLKNYDPVEGDEGEGEGGEDGNNHLDDTYNGKKHKSWDQNSELMFEQDVTWDDVAWLKNEATGPAGIPLVVKGIMTGEDAALAVEAGADGVMVSNHGGRALDGCLSSIDALPEVVHAVDGRVPVLLDGGVRRGTDVIKALAMGATAVGIGKPVFFALAVGGEGAVVNMLKMLQTEIEAAMAICGCQTVKDITPRLVTHDPKAAMAKAPFIRSAL